ncbi:MAG: hypothetical protein ACKVT1_21080 [Dehalococcoidia bacterium]
MAADIVRLVAYDGEIITRVAVREEDDVVLVCRPEELETAQREHREPRLVGFPKRSIVAS